MRRPRRTTQIERPTPVGPAPDVGLRGARALHRLAERLESHYVRLARRQGWSWEQIGDALGVSRQSVHTKHRRSAR